MKHIRWGRALLTVLIAVPIAITIEYVFNLSVVSMLLIEGVLLLILAVVFEIYLKGEK
jgi:hypothetical protein